MRIDRLSGVHLASAAWLLPAILILAMTPAAKAATNPIVFSGVESFPYGGTFQSATSVATDAVGNLYVSQPGQNQVDKIAPDGTRTLVAVAGLNGPRGLIVDASNNLWIANSTGTTIIRHPLGGGSDQTLAGFNLPYNFALDAAGTLYVSNSGNSTVVKVTGCPAACVITPLVTSGLTGGVRGLAVDTTGHLYIAVLTSMEVLVVSTTNGSVTNTFSPGCQARDVAVNAGGDLFIACTDKNIIYRVPNEAGILTFADRSVVATSGIPAGAGIHGLAFFGGTLYSTSGTTLVDKVQLDSVDLGSFLLAYPNATQATSVTLNFSAITTTPVGSVVAYSEGVPASDPNGSADYQIVTGTSCPVKGGSFSAGTSCTVTIGFFPNAVGLRHGGVVFSNTSAPQQPIFTLPIFGTGLGSRVSYTPGIINAFAPTVANVAFSGPGAIQLDGAGNRVVTDVLNNRVVKFDFNNAGGIVVGTGLTLPNGVAIDGSGNVYVSDGVLGVVMVPNENGTLNAAHQTVLTANVQFPAGLRFDPAQSLFIADSFNNRIVKIPYEDGMLNGLNQQVVATGFIQPGGVFPDPSGNVWVADTGNNRVVKVAPNGVQTPVVLNAALGPLDGPGDVVLDAAGDLYISDTNNARVIFVSADGSNQYVYPGAQPPAQPGFGGFGAMWIDPSGFLYIPDFNANRIEVVQNDPFPIKFPTTARGSTSAPQLIQATNIGNVALNFTHFVFPRDFRRFAVAPATANCYGSTTVAPGTSCFIGITFRPTITGLRSGNLSVSNTDLNANPPIKNLFPLTGTGQ